MIPISKAPLLLIFPNAAILIYSFFSYFSLYAVQIGYKNSNKNIISAIFRQKTCPRHFIYHRFSRNLRLFALLTSSYLPVKAPIFVFGAQAEVSLNHTTHPTHTKKIGGGNASRTPAPILKIKK
ncbi:hypothetical protein, partial [Segatella oulorum]|uniref:hypothetical protein n=1 Tax=Segatella oulorum TaxID=28136 RepID=UPI0028E95274